MNTQTERMVWPMPMLEVILDPVVGAPVFFALEFLKDTGNSYSKNQAKN